VVKIHRHPEKRHCMQLVTSAGRIYCFVCRPTSHQRRVCITLYSEPSFSQLDLEHYRNEVQLNSRKTCLL
jgi:hypothetical protein